jgi:hypothetical protein
MHTDFALVQLKGVSMNFQKYKDSGFANRWIVCELKIQTSLSQQRIKVFGYEGADIPKKYVKTFLEINRF